MSQPLPARRGLVFLFRQVLGRLREWARRAAATRLAVEAGLTVVATLAAPSPAWGGTTSALTLAPQSYAGSQARQYKVYVPDALGQPAPLVMVLHGCRQTHDDVLRDWGLAAAADRHGFVLVAPFITRYDGVRNANCWGFWMERHRHEGAGEVEDLHRIALEVEQRIAIDPARRYIAGLSSGGAMAVVAATTHNEYWAAAASASGLPYGEGSIAVSFAPCPGSARFRASGAVARDMRQEIDDPYAIPLLVLQNERDCTVIQSAGRHLRDAHLLAFGDEAHDTPDEARARQTTCAPAFISDFDCEQTYYTVDGAPTSRSIVETILYHGPIATPDTSDTDRGHYWIGGPQGADGRWSIQRGPSYPELVWDFFARHPRTDSSDTAPRPPEDNPPGAQPAHCVAVRSFVLTHVNEGRAVAGGFFGMRAASTGDRRDIGLTWAPWPLVTLWEGEAGRWFADRPAGCAA